MELQITQMLCPPSKYSIKCPYPMEAQFIVVHNTANDASAMSEISYMLNNNYETSYHFAVDDIRAVQGLPLNRNGWHASDGNGKGNRQGIGIEICYSLSGGERFIKAEQNTAYLIAQLLMERGWGIDRVKKHQDFCAKRCPHRTLDMGWQRFLNMVKGYMKPYTYVNNRDYASVFDPDYYKTHYSDVVKAYGTSPIALFNHFINYGMKDNEHRQANKEFNPEIYRANYPHLDAVFGNHYEAYYNHYIDYGKKEGKIANRKI